MGLLLVLFNMVHLTGTQDEVHIRLRGSDWLDDWGGAEGWKGPSAELASISSKTAQSSTSMESSDSKKTLKLPESGAGGLEK